MIDEPIKKGLKPLAVVFGIHMALGFLAVLSGGYFLYGLTAPERIAYHVLSGGEYHISFNGSPQAFQEDLCLQECEECTLKCYSQNVLNVSCTDGACVLRTKRGTLLAEEGDTFSRLMKVGILYEDARFKCYGGDCGFDLNYQNMTFSTQMPGVKASQNASPTA